MLESGIIEMGQWIVHHKWEKVTNAITAHDKAYILHTTLLEKLDEYLPEKNVKFTSEDQVWITPELKDLSRRKHKEFFKHRKYAKTI